MRFMVNDVCGASRKYMVSVLSFYICLFSFVFLCAPCDQRVNVSISIQDCSVNFNVCDFNSDPRSLCVPVCTCFLEHPGLYARCMQLPTRTGVAN